MVELRRAKARYAMSSTVWALTLELARLAGWVPAGTRKIDPDGGESVDNLSDVRHLMGWQTEYRSSDGQTVSNSDARMLANGVRKAALHGEQIIADWSAGTSPPVTGIRNEPKAFNWLTTTEGKTHLHNLADFCGLGEFQIF